MSDGDLVLLAWSDYVGITRVRGLVADVYPTRMTTGIGWAVAGQVLTPFDDLGPNPWGSMMEVRQIPVAETHRKIDIWGDVPALEMVLCDARTLDGKQWECGTRAFYENALNDFRAETGLEFMAAFEHEFQLLGVQGPDAPPFSIEHVRKVPEFLRDLARALKQANVDVESLEPEFGVNQFEVTTGPATGLAAGDNPIIVREVIREVARRLGYRATFTPKPTPTSVGNGAHVHFSFVDQHGNNATYDVNGPGNASLVAQHFIAGVVKYLPALCAYMASSPVSYLRLGPHHWACGYASFGIQNREAGIRICPSADPDPVKHSRSFNLEVRAPDATASPYIVLGSLIRAGLQGIRDELALPPAVEGDPSDLTQEQRDEMGIVPLPGSLREALEVLDADPVARSWMPDLMYQCFVGVKRTEIELAESLSDDELCERYRNVY